MKKIVTIAACIVTGIALGQERQDESHDRQRWNDRVYQWVGDMGIARDEIIKQGYFVLIDGVSISPATALASVDEGQLRFDVVNVPEETPFQRIYARRGKDFDYRAVNQITPIPSWSTGPEQQWHHWLEFVQAGEVTRGRLLVSSVNRQAPAYLDRPVGTSVGKWFIEQFASTKGFTPYDSFAAPYSLQYYGYRPDSIEKTLLESMQLRAVVPKVGGMFVSEWVGIQHGGELWLRITHDPSKHWMPTEVTLKSEKGWPKGMKVDHHMRLLEWRQIDRFWLPHMAEHEENFNGGDKRARQFLKLRWAVGGKAPESAFDLNTEDLRQPVLNHFGVEFMRIADGRAMPAPFYGPPADLLKQFKAD